MKSIVKNSKTLSIESLPKYISTLYTLNDGRIAIGGDCLSIYNINTDKVDIKIDLKDRKIKFILQLSDNKIFYYTRSYETEGPYTDEYFYNKLIELSENTYKDMTHILPKESKYNILREYSDKILFGGINYSNKHDKYYTSNASGEKRIEKLEKYENNNEYKSDMEDHSQDKYQITNSVNIDFIDFIVLNKNLIAVLLINRLDFYDVNELKKIKSSEKISNLYTCVRMAYFSENLIVIGTTRSIEIFDYSSFKTIKSISCVYPIKSIYTNENKVFIGESTTRGQNRITEYEIDETGNYNQIDFLDNPHNNELTDITQAKDGRLITSEFDKVKIWI